MASAEVDLSLDMIAPYMTRIIDDVFDTAGNCTVNVVVEVLSAPKSRTQTAGFPPPLW
jgi:hypothetical protein